MVEDDGKSGRRAIRSLGVLRLGGTLATDSLALGNYAGRYHIGMWTEAELESSTTPALPRRYRAIGEFPARAVPTYANDRAGTARRGHFHRSSRFSAAR